MIQNYRIIYYSGLLFISLLIIGSCVTPITPHLNVNDSKPSLVVEGQITDQTGPFRVKLTNTLPVYDLGTPAPVLNAEVRIIDDQGHSFQLYGGSNGIYETAEKDLKGIPGTKYTLYITTLEDNVQYTSTPVLMQEVPDIDTVYFEPVIHPRITEGKTYEDNWINILLDTHDTEGKNKYWRWEFEETWEINLLADPVKDRHSLTSAENFSMVFVAPIDDKKICWITQPSGSIVVANTDKNPVDEIKGLLIQSIGPYDTRLHIRYSILVKQYSLDQDSYNYWNQLKDINENSGSMYSKIPAPIYGNITCCEGTGKALGYFAASTVKEKRIFINRSDHNMETININSGCTYFDYAVPQTQQKIYFGPDVLSGSPVYTSSAGCADCTLFGTNVKPSFW
jgi:hypothetical protein